MKVFLVHNSKKNCLKHDKCIQQTRVFPCSNGKISFVRNEKEAVNSKKELQAFKVNPKSEGKCGFYYLPTDSSQVVWLVCS